MRSSTFTKAIAGRMARSAKHRAGQSMTGPTGACRFVRSDRVGSRRRAAAPGATQSPGRRPMTCSCLERGRRTHARIAGPGLVSSRQRRSRRPAWESQGELCLSDARLHKGSTSTGGPAGLRDIVSRRSPDPWKRGAFIVRASGEFLQGVAVGRDHPRCRPPTRRPRPRKRRRRNRRNIVRGKKSPAALGSSHRPGGSLGCPGRRKRSSVRRERPGTGPSCRATSPLDSPAPRRTRPRPGR